MALVGQWQHSMFGCFDDFGICIITYLAPCVTFGQTAELIGEGSCLACGLASFIPIFNIVVWLGIRGRIREMKGIEGSTFLDCIAVIFCPICALIQEAQEVKGGVGPSALSMSRE